MDWSLFDMLLHCQPGHERLYLIMLALGGLASIATAVGAVRALWRRWFGPSGAMKRAARVLRNEGKYHAQLKHRARAMDLYESSIRLNPRAGHVYYLRGNLRHEMADTNRAIADWRRCLLRLPRHADAKRRLAENVADPPAMFPWPIAVGTFASVLLISLVGWLGLWVLHQRADLSLNLFPFHMHEKVSPTQKIFRDRLP
jgi:tetratricopeptide (TPR) repeat protein